MTWATIRALRQASALSVAGLADLEAQLHLGLRLHALDLGAARLGRHPGYGVAQVAGHAHQPGGDLHPGRDRVPGRAGGRGACPSWPTSWPPRRCGRRSQAATGTRYTAWPAAGRCPAAGDQRQRPADALSHDQGVHGRGGDRPAVRPARHADRARPDRDAVRARQGRVAAPGGDPRPPASWTLSSTGSRPSTTR
jgi:hypothetical protein